MSDLAFEFEFINNLFYVRAKAIEIIFKVGLQNLLTVGSRVIESLQSPFASVVKYIAACIFQPSFVPFGKASFIPLKGEFFHHRLFAWFEQGIQSSQDHHWQNDITVFTSYIYVS